MKPQYIAYVLLFVAGVWGGNMVIKMFGGGEQQIIENQMELHVFNFSLPDLEGVSHQFNEWDGKVRVLNFWASWCAPCRKETPMFVELQDQLGSKGLQFIGVAIDDKQKVQDFVDSYGVNYPTLIGTTNAIEVAEKYGNRHGALPYTVVINREGTVVHAQAGEMTRQKTEKIISALL